MRNNITLNSKTLRFEASRLTIKQRLVKWLKYFSGGLFLALLAWGVFSYYSDYSYNTILLSYQNDVLVNRLTEINRNFDSISNRLSAVQQNDDELYRVIVEMEELSETERKAGFGGTESYSDLKGFENGEFLVESNRKGDQLLKQLEVQVKSYNNIGNAVYSKSDSILSVPGIFPIYPDKYWITSGYGYRFHPILKVWDMHDGVDISAEVGRDIYATGKGVVCRVSNSPRGYGKMVLVDHGYGYKTRYAHLHKISVRKGDSVSRGQVVGLLGNTGRSTGPHLHYEVILNDKRVNPANYYVNDLTKSEYMKMLHSFN